MNFNKLYWLRPFVAMLCFFALCCFGQISVNAQVRINEVLVNPQTNSTSSQFQSLKMCSQPTYGHEYIELYNANACDSIDISCYLIGYNNGTGPLNGTFRFPLGTKIGPLSFLSIGGPNSNATINLTNFCSNPHLSTGNDRWYLPNGDGYLILWNNNGVAIDAVYWTFNPGEANKWGTDSDIQSAPTFIATGTSCPAVASLTGPSGIPAASPIVHYAGVSPSIGTVIHRTTDGGSTWASNATPTLNACNGTCAVSNAVNITALNATNPGCGNNNGTISITQSGGTAPYTYQWSNAATTATITALSAGVYQVTVTDAAGCSDIASTTLTATSGTTTSSAVIIDAACGAANGAINLSVSGGSGSYSFLWSNSATTEDITGLTSGFYYISITDLSNSCVAVDTYQVNITGASLLLTGSNSPNNTCGNSGPCPVSDSVLINEVMHKPGPNTTTNQGLRRKEYVEIYNAGCRPVDISCWVIGSANMGIQTVANPAYTGGFQFPSGTIIAPGQHIVVGGTESQDSTSYSTTFIDFNVANYVGTNTCDPNTNWLLPNGDGWVALYNAQGNAVDALYWSFFSGPNINTDDDFASNPCIPTACSGISSLASARQIFNANPALINYGGVSTNNDLTFSRVPDGGLWQRNIAPSISNAGNGNCNAACVTPPQATGNCNGTASINASAGTAPYSFLWSNGQTTQTATGLCAGTYSVTVTDVNGCSGASSVSVGLSNSFALTASGTNLSCANSANGTVTANPTGGNAPYSFIWSNAATTAQVSGLAAGQYVVTVTDNGACQALDTIVITAPAALVLSSTSTNISCNGGANGTLSLTVVGGTPVYSFIWSNAASTEDLNALTAGNYSVTVTDANACVTTLGPLSLTEPTAITTTSTVTNASCGNNNGAITLSTSGGTAGYSFAWNNGLPSVSNPPNLAGGTYTVTITDANNCTFSTSAIVSAGTPVFFTLSATDEACGQANSGAIDLTINSGTAPFSFIWSNAVSTEDLNNLAAGSYTAIVVDSFGCADTSNIVVNAPLQPLLNAQILPTNAGDTSIALGATLSLSGGNDQTAQGVTYLWTAAPGTAGLATPNNHQTIIEPTTAGNYVFVVTAISADGCVDTDTLTVSVESFSPQIPTAFSPNGDNNNPVFQVVGIDKSFLREFKIYNRWGQLIYDNPTEGAWDGTFKNEAQPREVYMYIISWQSPIGGEDVVKRGQVTLLR